MQIIAYVVRVPAPLATSDVFTALAEPRRRAIMDELVGGELPVNDIVERTTLDQPTVSKHLRVLREAGLVHVRRDGRQRLYTVNGTPLRDLHEWATKFDRFWDTQLDGIKRLAESSRRNKGTTP